MRRPGGDPHTLASLNIYGREAFLAKEKAMRKKLRDAVKTTVYASLYRAGKVTVWKSIRKKKMLPADLRASMTLPVVSHIYDSYFGKYVEIPAWHDNNLRLAATQGYLEIPPLGRRRYFPVQPPPYSEVASWPIQTLGSDYVTMEMVHIQDILDRKFNDAWIILHAHDALYIECYERDAEAIKRIVDHEFGRSVLEGPAGTVILSAEAKIGKNLLEVK
jgi:DNA polymerase I-like protein with 3'-5' exonuclease and polymerase domains